MTPKLQVAELYRKYRQPRSFVVDMHLHQKTGYVLDTPDAFLMGRPVTMSAPIEALLDPRVSFRREDCDAWLIWAFAGDLKRIGPLAPFPLPYSGWARRGGGIRWYASDKAWQIIRRGIHFGKPNASCDCVTLS